MQRHQACTEEGRLMELLADEEAGEERVPDQVTTLMGKKILLCLAKPLKTP